MKKYLTIALSLLVLIAVPVTAQRRADKRRAKSEAKAEARAFKKQDFEFYGTGDLREELYSHLLAKYSDKNNFEVLGKALDQEDMAQAKTLARELAVGSYPEEDIASIFFVWRKAGRKSFDVYCYAVLQGVSAADALRRDSPVVREFELLEKEQAVKEARKRAEKAKKEREKALKEAKKAQKEAEKARKEAQKAAKEAQKLKD